MSLAARQVIWEQRWQRWRSGPASLAGYLEARAEYDETGRALGVPPDILANRLDVGTVPVEQLVPRGHDPQRAVLYLHGGAFVMGSLEASRQGAVLVARAAPARVVNVGYRLAPEHPFPSALDDALVVYRWMLREVADPGQLVVVGSSAGGGLAVSLLLASGAAGLPLPSGLVTLSAWTDLRCAARSYRTRARRDPSLTPAGLRLAASLYLAGASPDQPMASPVLGDLRGLPPTLALVGTEEVLLDDTLALVERLRVAGVEARSHIGWGMVHCWTGFAGRLPEADDSLARIGSFIRDRTR